METVGLPSVQVHRVSYHTSQSSYGMIADALMRVITGVLNALNQGVITGGDVVNSMIAISRVAEGKMGGTSGALYSCVSYAVYLDLVSGCIQDFLFFARSSSGSFFCHRGHD